MMNYLQNLRMKNLFPVAPIPDYGAEVNPQPIAPIDNTGVNAQQPFDVASRMSEIYTPETAAQDRYNSLIENQPQYENPSFLRTIAASLAAFGPGGQQSGDEVMNWHNNRNMMKWKNSLAPAQHAADNERQANVNERTLAHQTVSSELRARADAEKERNNEEVNKIRRHRASIYEFKAKNPNMKILSPKGGNVIAVDPSNPNKVITLTDEDGKPISSGSLSDTDRINLEQKNDLEKIDARTGGQLEVEASRQGGRTDIAETRGWQIGSIPDPNDPTKQIGVRINQITGETVPIKFGDQNPVFSKPGGPNKPGNAPNPQVVQDKARETKDVLDQLIDEKGNLTKFAQSAVGANRILPTFKVPGSQGYSANTAINNLKSKLVLNLIGEMKAQSRTGATGFGAMNVKELGVLEAAIGQLDPNMPEADFARELVKIREKMNRILQPSDSYNPTVTTAPKAKKTLEQLKKEYNF